MSQSQFTTGAALSDLFDEITRVSEGATSVVYRARRASDRRKVILKVLRGPHPGPRAIEEFRKEFHVASSLVGSSLTPPLDFLDLVEPAIVFEDLGCVSVATLVADGPLSADDVTRIGADIAQALVTLHANGVVHRDVSAGNVLRSPVDGHAYLIDFGLSTRTPREQSRDSHRLHGTLLYISPEQTGRTNARVDERSDLYSLGATLYHLATGRPPFVAPDALGVLHGHLARQPQPPARLQESVPPALSDIILHCLQKSPDDRYQSATGLLADLQWLRDQKPLAAPADWSPGRSDRSLRIRPTEQLVGRESEVATLREAFRGARDGKSRLVAVKGWSGIGKSRLVMELVPDVTADQGAFLCGKHELLARGTPYSGLKQALGNWVRHVVADPIESASAVRERIRNTLGDQAGALAPILPELELLLGDLTPVSPLPPAESEARIAVLFRTLIRQIAGPQRPLVLFLDDLQWADSATLQVISHIATDPGSQHVLVVVAWRDNEVPDGHPVAGLISELASDGADITTITVTPMSASAIMEWTARSLQTDADSVQDLARALFGASGGSPFYAGRLLMSMHEDRALRHDESGWHWDGDADSLSDTPADAVVFLQQRLERMSPDAQRALSAGAWLGASFSVSDVARTLSVGLRQATSWMEEAAALHAVQRHDDSPVELATLTDDLDPELAPQYRFAHDRVQQAASELVPIHERPALRLGLARLLSKQQGGRPYEAVDHAIAAGQALDDPYERRRFAELASVAGFQAIDAAAFSVARRAFLAGIDWLGPDRWKLHEQLARRLELGAAEASYLDADRRGMEKHVAQVLAHSHDPVTRLRAEEIAGLAHTAANEIGAGIDRMTAAITGAGMPLPANPSMVHVLGGLVQTRWALRNSTPESLAALPLCTDELVRTRMRLEATLFSPAFYGRPLLFPLLAFTLVRESLAHGVAAESPLGLVVYGIVLCTTGSIQSGIEYGQIALKLNERLHDRRLRYRTQHIWNAHLRFWFERWQNCRDDLKRIHRGCWESGDIEYAAFAAFMSCTLGLHTGESLPELHERNRLAIEAIRSMGQQTALHTTLMHHQIIENLMGLADNPARLVGNAYDETTMEYVHTAANDRVNLHCLAVSRAMVAVYHGNMEAAATAMRAADPWDQDARSQPLHVMGRFFDALAHAATGNRRRANRQLRELRRWATIGPAALDHRVAMVEAELAASEGHVSQAISLWERACSLASMNGYHHERALALERSSRFHERMGHGSLARSLALEARAAYDRWGARARVEALDRQRPGASTASTFVSSRHTSGPLIVSGPNASVQSVGAASPHGDAPLDLEALLAAARRIASEVEGNRDTSALLEGTLVLAGASTATLYRLEADSFRPALVAVTESDLVRTSAGDHPSIISPLLAEAARTQTPVVVPGPNHPLHTDAALRQLRARSAVAIPIVTGGNTTAMMLVTHSLLEDAFPERRLAPMQALAAQAGIALENALHYEELDQRVRVRTSELLAARREAEAERDRADRILLNVLPEPIADELKRTGRAQPVSVPSATVLFTDFAGFTQLASDMSAESLVAELERCFAAFDDIVDRHNITKLKTIGDAYMAVGGLPTPTESHARDVVRAGLDMAQWIARPSDGGPPIPFRVRIGVHTGPLVAGVIGKRRFLYDVWGDTVNIAARMESSGEPGRVNISQQTLDLLNDRFHITPRGLVAAKGKGELPMYFVESEIHD